MCVGGGGGRGVLSQRWPVPQFWPANMVLKRLSKYIDNIKERIILVVFPSNRSHRGQVVYRSCIYVGMNYNNVGLPLSNNEERGSSMAERPFIFRWVVRLIRLGGSIGLFIVPVSAPRLV